MTGEKNIWSRQRTYTENQRDYRLPPMWVSRPKRSKSLSESGRSIHIPGRNRELARRIISLMTKAKEKIVMSSFLLADRQIEEAILDAADRKVRVYILLASEVRLEIDHTDDEFEQEMFKQHRDMLNRLGGYALFRSAPNFHAKFVLADPGNRNGAGLLMTANLTKEALERNQELAVELTHEEVDEAFAFARWAFWEYAQHELIDPKDHFRPFKSPGLIAHPTPMTSILGTTTEIVQLRDETVRLIENAQKEILVASFGWDEDHEVVEYLSIRASEGLPVTVLARVRKSEMPALITLARSGASVLGFNWLHAKAVCVDSDSALVMSANLQSDGLNHGFELGVTLNSNRAVEVHDRLLGWYDMARWELLANPALGDITGEVRVWHEKQFEETSVKAKSHIDLGEVIAESADRLDETKSPDLPPLSNLPELAHDVVYEWRVNAPVLAKKSRQVFRSSSDKKSKRIAYNPPVFDEPSGRRVVAIGSPNDIEKARQIANSTSAKAIVVKPSFWV